MTASEDHTARVWDVLLGSGSLEATAKLTDLAKGVSGYQVNELGSLIFLGLDDQRKRLNQLRQLAGQSRDGETGSNAFIRGFLSGIR